MAMRTLSWRQSLGDRCAGMLVRIPAFVSTSSGGFEASVLRLTTTALGLLAPIALPVGTKVSVTFFSVALEGWVSRADPRDPRAFQVDFFASTEARRLIEERLKNTRFPQSTLDWGEATAPMTALSGEPRPTGPDDGPGARFGDESTESTEPSHPAVLHLPEAASEDISLDMSSSEFDAYESGISFDSMDSMDSIDSLAGFDSMDSLDAYERPGFDGSSRPSRPSGRYRARMPDDASPGFEAADSLSVTLRGDDFRAPSVSRDPSRDMDIEETLSVGVEDPVAQMTARVDELEDVLMAMYSDAEDTDSAWDEDEDGDRDGDGDGDRDRDGDGEPVETVRSRAPVPPSRS